MILQGVIDSFYDQLAVHLVAVEMFPCWFFYSHLKFPSGGELVPGGVFLLILGARQGVSLPSMYFACQIT